jgi:serine/threonine-protein kinase
VSSAPVATKRTIGRYDVRSVLGTGGMATVYLARQRGAAGFSRIVAVKAMQPAYASDAAFSKMFVDEARLAARVRHPNVVATIDVVETDGELLHVLEWIDGESIARLAPVLDAKKRVEVPLPIASAIMCGVLAGLHAAHEAKDERGEPLGLVHRDVSPQNVMVGVDGVPRVLDFGIAKARGRLHTTKDGSIRGKLPYMPPDQLQSKPVTRRNDIYAAGVVLWELITSRPLIEPGDEASVVMQILTGLAPPPSRYRTGCPPDLDDVVLKALESDPEKRFESAEEMALALERVVPPATALSVGAWVRERAEGALRARRDAIEALEREDDEAKEAAPPEEAPSIKSRAAFAVGSAPAPSTSPPPTSPISRALPLLALAVVATVGVVGYSKLRAPARDDTPPATLARPPATTSGEATIASAPSASISAPRAEAPPLPKPSAVTRHDPPTRAQIAHAPASASSAPEPVTPAASKSSLLPDLPLQ